MKTILVRIPNVIAWSLCKAMFTFILFLPSLVQADEPFTLKEARNLSLELAQTPSADRLPMDDEGKSVCQKDVSRDQDVWKVTCESAARPYTKKRIKKRILPNDLCDENLYYSKYQVCYWKKRKK